MSCHNCGIREGTYSNPGRTVSITLAPEYGQKRQRKVGVWCCSDECAVQALGTSKWGPSHKWPISLAKFRSTVKCDARDTSRDHHQVPSQSIVKENHAKENNV